MGPPPPRPPAAPEPRARERRGERPTHTASSLRAADSDVRELASDSLERERERRTLLARGGRGARARWGKCMLSAFHTSFTSFAEIVVVVYPPYRLLLFPWRPKGVTVR